MPIYIIIVRLDNIIGAYRAGIELVNNRDIPFIMIRYIPNVGIFAGHVVDSYRLLLLASQVSL